MRFKIVSDGTAQGTLITDADTGEEIRGVTVIEWKIDAARGISVVRLVETKVELVGEGVAEKTQRKVRF